MPVAEAVAAEWNRLVAPEAQAQAKVKVAALADPEAGKTWVALVTRQVPPALQQQLE